MEVVFPPAEELRADPVPGEEVVVDSEDRQQVRRRGRALLVRLVRQQHDGDGIVNAAPGATLRPQMVPFEGRGDYLK